MTSPLRETIRQQQRTTFEDAVGAGDVAGVQRGIDLGQDFHTVGASRVPSTQATSSVDVLELLLANGVSPNARHPTHGGNALHHAVALGAAAAPPEPLNATAVMTATAAPSAEADPPPAPNDLTEASYERRAPSPPRRPGLSPLFAASLRVSAVHPRTPSPALPPPSAAPTSAVAEALARTAIVTALWEREAAAPTPAAVAAAAARAPVDAACAADPFVSARLEVLWRYAVDATATDAHGHTPAVAAARHGNRAALDFFVVNGVPIPPEALHHACGCGQLPTAKFLLGLPGSHAFAVATPRGDDGSRALPLHAAASHGRVAVVEYLVSVQGARLDATDAFGRTALHCAAEGRDGNEAVMEAILRLAAALADASTDAPAVPESRSPVVLSAAATSAAAAAALVESLDRGGRTALESALRAGHRANAAWLLARGRSNATTQSASALWRAHKTATLPVEVPSRASRW